VGRRFPRSQRLTRGADLQTVRREGKRIRTEHLEVRATASLLRGANASATAAGRVGIVVPKHKRSSVERNRLKRRLRELARTLLLPALPPSVDLVVRTFPESYDASFAALAREVGRVRERVRQLYGGAE
jgi:ribonuclease P protein component